MSRAADPRPVAVVTGASRGLGRVIARSLAGEGFDLILTARTPEGLAEVARELETFGVPVERISGDLVDPSVRAKLAEAVARRGRLDRLVNNAAILGPAPLPKLAAYPLGELETVFRVNVVAPLALVQSVLPALSSAHGQIVNLSSDAAVGGYPGWGGYGASKAALDLLSLTLAHEVAELGVSVVSVDPGDMRTPGVERALPAEEVASRPLPEVTLPFWAWLWHQDPAQVSGRRFQAQSERWEVSA